MIQKLPGDLGLDFGGGRGIAPDTGSANVQRACDVLKDLILGCLCCQLCPELRLTACSSLADSSDGGGDSWTSSAPDNASALRQHPSPPEPPGQKHRDGLIAPELLHPPPPTQCSQADEGFAVLSHRWRNANHRAPRWPKSTRDGREHSIGQEEPHQWGSGWLTEVYTH